MQLFSQVLDSLATFKTYFLLEDCKWATNLSYFLMEYTKGEVMSCRETLKLETLFFFFFHSYLHQLKHVMTYINKDTIFDTRLLNKKKTKKKRPTPKRQTKDNMIIWWIKD
jgi:hypothetical protein